MFQEEIIYEKIKKSVIIGKGTFGKVYKCNYEGFTCALKTLVATDRLREAQRKKYADSLRLEAKTLAKLGRCENVVQYIGTCIDPKQRLCVLMEFVNGKNLAKFIEEEFPKHPWSLRDNITLDIAKGITYIHSKDIIHRDLKSENILIDNEDNFKAKIADFGVAKVSEEIRGTIETFSGAGSPPWMAPELFLNSRGLPSKKTDMYSFGMIMWEMATEKRPYEDRNKQEIRYLKEQGIIEKVPPTVPPTYERLLRRCMDFDASNRPYGHEIAELLEKGKLNKNNYETNICFQDQNDLATLFLGDVDKIAAQISATSGQYDVCYDTDSDSDSEQYHSSKLEHLLSSLSQGDEGVKEKLIEEYEVNPEDETTLELSLGNCHYRGVRVPVNYEQAAKHYEKAVQLGNKEALLKLGICYKLGHGKPSSPHKAFQLISQASNAGVISSLGYLGECYFNGIGVPANIDEAIKAFKTGAADNDPTSHFYLGRCYYSGLGVHKDFHKAVKHFASAARQGHAEAQLNIGIVHKTGITKPPDDEEAFRWFLKSAEQDNPTAQNNVGSCYYFGVGIQQNFSLAARWFKSSAQQGNPGGMHNIADCYLNGKGVEMDKERAAEWFLKASNLGHGLAQNSLGRCYLEGHGVSKNPGLAFQWFQKSAETGCVQGLFGLAICYRDGIGTTKSFNQAMFCFEQAADQGSPQAQVALALLHLDQNNDCEKRDPTQAFRWFHTAAEIGDPGALFHLGRCYVLGIGIEKDPRRGFNCFVKSANKNHVEAQNTLGSFYYQGTSTPVDYDEAAKWFIRAADAKHPLAEYNLAECYLKGRGVSQSTSQAVDYYQRAANQNHAPAQYVLGSLYERGQGVNVDIEMALRYYRMAANKLPQAQQRINFLNERITKPLPTPVPPPPPSQSECCLIL